MENSTNLYQKLHKDSDKFGARKNAGGLTDNMESAIKALSKQNVKSILDYGTGKGNFVQSLRKTLGSQYVIDGYDPAVKEWSKKATGKYDIVTCIDVLEHLEYDTIDKILCEIRDSTKLFSFLLIDLQPAVQYLANGRNAHTLLAPHDWWQAKISRYFPYNISFPIYHQGGYIQKQIVIGSFLPTSMNPMMLFANKLDIFNVMMSNPRSK